MRRAAVIALLAALALVAAGCGGQQTVAPTAETVIGTLPKQKQLVKGDPAAGKAVFAANGCGGCHTFKPAGSSGAIGPDLDKLAADAKKANQGSLEEYTATSITNPSAYTVPGFQSGVMPAYPQLSDRQLADLVAFLTQGS